MLDSVRAQVGYPAIVKPNKGSGSAGEDGAGVPLELETETNERMTTRRFLIPTRASQVPEKHFNLNGDGTT